MCFSPRNTKKPVLFKSNITEHPPDHFRTQILHQASLILTKTSLCLCGGLMMQRTSCILLVHSEEDSMGFHRSAWHCLGNVKDVSLFGLCSLSESHRSWSKCWDLEPRGMWRPTSRGGAPSALSSLTLIELVPSTVCCPSEEWCSVCMGHTHHVCYHQSSQIGHREWKAQCQLFEQGAAHFHFALNLTNHCPYLAIPNQC